MAEEPNKKEPDQKFEGVIDALHNKSKLSSLRSYQGDMAEFIKEKNESVLSVAVKEKVRKEEREAKQKETSPEPKHRARNFQINLTMLTLSLLLIAGGAVAFFYIFVFTQREPSAPTMIETDLIPYNNSVTLANTGPKNLSSELAKLSLKNGVNLIKVSDSSGKLINKTQGFFDFLQIPSTLPLRITLKDEFVFGSLNQNGQNSFFLILSVNDFGRAFSSMLDWEERLSGDLSFITSQSDNQSSAYSWRDLIVKNKDTRVLTDGVGNVKLAYTFLNKSTILISDSPQSLADISNIYASRAVVR